MRKILKKKIPHKVKGDSLRFLEVWVFFFFNFFFTLFCQFSYAKHITLISRKARYFLKSKTKEIVRKPPLPLQTHPEVL